MNFDLIYKYLIVIVLILLISLYFKGFQQLLEVTKDLDVQSKLYRKLNNKVMAQFENSNISRELINYSDKLLDKYQNVNENTGFYL